MFGQGIAMHGKVCWPGITIYRIQGGKVAEERGVEDRLGFPRQIGGMPGPASVLGAVLPTQFGKGPRNFVLVSRKSRDLFCSSA